MMNNKANLPALYVHIPFCDKVCTYCDFYKMSAKTEKKAEYVRYIVQEIELKKNMFKDIETVYIGGGTPSALPLESLDLLLTTLWKYLDSKKVIEFTTEANPNHINQEYINVLKKHHINRISLGVQSFDENKLKFLGRLHTKEETINSIKLLQDNALNNVSIDLIYAIPNDSYKSVKKDLKIIKKLKINHVSAYSLILEEKTILNYLHEKGKFKMLDEDAEFNIYKKLNRYLHRLGLNQYEVSNYAKVNFQGKHNLQYWNNYHYLGIGAGASYYIDNIRYTNVMNLEKYYEGIRNKKLNYSEEIIVSKIEQMQEEMLMGLRKTIGVNIVSFKQKFNEDLFSTFPFINDLIAQKLLEVKNNNIYIPKKKLYLSNSILIHFV